MNSSTNVANWATGFQCLNLPEMYCKSNSFFIGYTHGVWKFRNQGLIPSRSCNLCSALVLNPCLLSNLNCSSQVLNPLRHSGNSMCSFYNQEKNQYVVNAWKIKSLGINTLKILTVVVLRVEI